MKEEIKRDFDILVSVEVEKLDRQLQLDVQSTVNQLVRTGNLHGTAGLRAVFTDAGRSIPTRVQTALNILLRSMTAHGVALTEDNKEETISTLRQWTNSQIAQLQEVLASASPYGDTAIAKFGGEPLIANLTTLGDLEIKRAIGECNLIAASNARGSLSTSPASQTYVFNAPVGLVQSGPGSYGTANQNIDASSRADIERALLRVEEALKNASNDADFDRREIAEMVSEAQTEVAKDTPNASKVKALITGVAGAISFTPRFKEAYDTLKWAAALIGVTLP